MKSLDQLMAERDALEKQITQARTQERGNAIKQAKELVKTFSLTARELGLGADGATKGKRGRKAPTGAKSTVAAKYKDKEGNTWTGRGKMPTWLSKAVAGGKKKEDFLI